MPILMMWTTLPWFCRRYLRVIENEYVRQEGGIRECGLADCSREERCDC